MSPVIAEPMCSAHLMLSTRLVYELGDPHSTLRATTDRNGAAVLINAGGEIDACNEHTWRQLVSEAASVIIPPGPFVVDVTGSISWAAARSRCWPRKRNGARSAVSNCAWSAASASSPESSTRAGSTASCPSTRLRMPRSRRPLGGELSDLSTVGAKEEFLLVDSRR